MKSSILALAATALAAVALAGSALAYDPPGAPRGAPRGAHMDARYGHNQYYPSRGYTLAEHPREGYAVGGGRYWFSGGVWYAPYGGRWIVAGPPIGVFVPVLPALYTTVWFGGIPYYYANDTYYVYRDPTQGYEVVDPPAGPQPSVAQPATDEVIMYPKAGQDDAQQGKDRYECHRWASDQTGFDPTRPADAASVDATRERRSAYMRAMGACLEGRGYSVK
jgi:hypothetical protein